MELRNTIKNQNAEAGAAQVSWPDSAAVSCPDFANSTLYLVQEFLSTGEHGFWNTTSRLEVTFSQPGGPVAKNWRLRVG